MKTWQRAFSIRLGVGGFMEFAVRREEYRLIKYRNGPAFIKQQFQLSISSSDLLIMMFLEYSYLTFPEMSPLPSLHSYLI